MCLIGHKNFSTLLKLPNSRHYSPGAAPRGGGGGDCPPPPLWFFFFFLLVSSAVSHVPDDNTPTHYVKKKNWSRKKKVPPPPPAERLFQGCRKNFLARAAVARHFAPPHANTLVPPLLQSMMISANHSILYLLPYWNIGPEVYSDNI